MFEAFDFADPSMVVGRRNSSTVATQALFLMNHPFVLQQASGAASRLLSMEFTTVEDRVTYAYQLILGRSPTTEERAIASEFVSDPSRPEETSWSLLVQTLFATIDFRYAN
jgi:hypothetical protein